MKHLWIEEPCAEKWDQMEPSHEGAFCEKCTTTVIDFTHMTSHEIKHEFKKLGGGKFCSRFKTEQLSELNRDFFEWRNSHSRSFQSTFILSMVLVFGLGLFSCSNEKQTETIKVMQKEAVKMIAPEKQELPKIEEEDNILTLETEVVPQDIAGSVQSTRCFIGEDIEEVNIVKVQETEYYIMGAPAMTTIFKEYVEQLPEPVIEYDENGFEIPKEPVVLSFPNPATIHTNLKIGSPYSIDQAIINLFNMNGQLIRNVHSGPLRRGTTQFEIDLSDQQPGMYLITIHSKEYSETVRISKI